MRLGSETNQVLQGGDGRGLACLVGRELCLFTTIDIQKIPEKERAGFVALAVKRAAPFADPDHGVAWSSRHAAIWYWPRSRVVARLGEGEESTRVSFSPEAIYTGGPIEEGSQLLALLHGFEGRIWREARLVSSKWWALLPDPAEWAAFIRSAGLSPDDIAAIPHPIDGAINEYSWGGKSRTRRLPGGHGLDSHLPKAAFALGLVTIAVYAFQSGSLLRNHYDAWRAERAALNLDEPIKRVLDAREAADRSRSEIDALLALRQGRPQLALMAEASRLLPGTAWEMRRWSQPTPDRLELELMMPDANPEQLVAAWEASPLFDEVTTDLQPRSNLVTLRARVVPLVTVVP